MSGPEKPRERDDIGKLIQLAGPRAAVSPERLQRARARVHGHWRTSIEDQASKATWYTPSVAVAAVVLLGMGALLLVWRTPGVSPPVTMAYVERVIGNVTISETSASPDQALAPNATIRTAADGRLALRLAGGQSLRVGGKTVLVVASAERVVLTSGAVYLDSDPGSAAGPVTIRTPLGVTRDIGTQFQVRLQDSALIVGVREGLVEISRSGRQQVSVPAGEFLELRATGNEQRHQIPGTDPRWDWVQEVTPEFHIEGATLAEFLAWYVRERGLRLLWHDKQSEQNAQDTRLRGSIEGLSLDEALQAVERTTGFEYRLEGDALQVTVQ